MCRHRLSTLLAASIVLFGGGPSLGRQICKPQLSFKEVRSSEPRNLEWKWTAVLAVDASACATTSGRFEINFLREKEEAPELEFSERFTWQTGELRIGRIEVSIDFWMDEAVYEYSVGYVTPCGCRNEQSGGLTGSQANWRMTWKHSQGRLPRAPRDNRHELQN